MFSLPFFNEGPGDEATSAHAANDSVYCWFSIYTAFDRTKYSGARGYGHVIASTNGVDFFYNSCGTVRTGTGTGVALPLRIFCFPTTIGLKSATFRAGLWLSKNDAYQSLSFNSVNISFWCTWTSFLWATSHCCRSIHARNCYGSCPWLMSANWRVRRLLMDLTWQLAGNFLLHMMRRYFIIIGGDWPTLTISCAMSMNWVLRNIKGLCFMGS